MELGCGSGCEPDLGCEGRGEEERRLMKCLGFCVWARRGGDGESG